MKALGFVAMYCTPLEAEMLFCLQMLSGHASSVKPAPAGTEPVVARRQADEGENGPVWWSDGAPHCYRRMLKNTPYAARHTDAPA